MTILTLIEFVVIYVVGVFTGYILNSVLNINKRHEELKDAYEKGKAFERMSNNRKIDD